MGIINNIWEYITPTKALDECRGPLQRAFFETVLRINYFYGFSTSDRGSYLKYQYFVFVIISSLPAGIFWYILSGCEMEVMMECMGVIIEAAITVYRYNNMVKHRDTFDRLASATESPYFDKSTNARIKLVEYWIARNDKFMKLLLALGVFTVAAWYIYPLLDDIEYNFPVGVRVPLDHRMPLRYKFTYITIVVMFNFEAFFIVCNDLIMQTHLIHLLCQLSVLTDCFKNIMDDCRSDFIETDLKILIEIEDFQRKYIKRLDNLVKQHQFLLRNTLDLKNILSTAMLLQFGASSVKISFTAYQTTVAMTNTTVNITKFLKNFFYLGYNLFQLFIFCRWCNEITSQCESISEAVYSSGWECGIASNPEVRTRLMVIIARANKPIVLSAGGFYDLSLESYATVLKASYSALMILLGFQ